MSESPRHEKNRNSEKDATKKIEIAKPVRAEAIQVSLPQISGPACQDAVFADASVDSRAPVGDRSFGVV